MSSSPLSRCKIQRKLGEVGNACFLWVVLLPDSPPRQNTIIIMIRAHERAWGAVGEDRRMKSPQCESKVVKEHTPKIEVSVS